MDGAANLWPMRAGHRGMRTSGLEKLLRHLEGAVVTSPPDRELVRMCRHTARTGAPQHLPDSPRYFPEVVRPSTHKLSLEITFVFPSRCAMATHPTHRA